MTAYKIHYQARSKAGKAGVRQGEWQDKQGVVVVENDGREAIDTIIQASCNYDLRITKVECVVNVDMLSKNLRTLISQEHQESQSTTE